MVRVAKAINSPEVFYKIAVLKNFTKFTENTCARVYSLIKLQAEETPSVAAFAVTATVFLLL